MRYAVDFTGYIYIDADNDDAAMQKASETLSAALPYSFHDGDWEIVNIEGGV